MGADIYTGFWEGILPEVIQHLKNGENEFEIDLQNIKALSGRKFESTTYRIKCGELLDDKNIHAYNRDFVQVILKSDYYLNHLFEKEISISAFKKNEAKLLFKVSSEEIEQIYFDVISDKNPGEEVIEAYTFLLNCLKNHPNFAVKLTEKKSSSDEMEEDEKNVKVSLKLERISSKYDSLFKMNRPFSFTVNTKFLSFFIREKASFFKPSILKESFKGKPNSANEFKIRLYTKADAKKLFEYISDMLENISEEALRENELKLKLLEDYKLIIKAKGFENEKYKWELIQEQKGHPNISSTDFTNEINNLDLNNLSYRYSLPAIKEIAISFPEELRKLFIELQNASDNLSERIIIFKKGADDLYSLIKEGKKPFQDERVIAAYLTVIKPDDYTLYKDTYYQSYCKFLGIKSKNANYKYEHYLSQVKDLALNYYPVDSELQKLEKEHLGELITADPNHMLLMQDMLYRCFDQDHNISEESSAISELEMKESRNMKSLNQILYGPPGTGKTYHTINKALEIIDPDYLAAHLNERELLTSRFKRLIESNQIVFTTFHQSMTYEDFVEGIKPIEPEKEGDPVVYKVEDGIFKKLCIEASFSKAKMDESAATEGVLSFSLAFDNFVTELEDRLSNEEQIELVTKNGGKVVVEGMSQQGNILIKHPGKDNIYPVSKNRLSKLHAGLPSLSDVNNIDQQFRSIIGGSNSTANWSVLNVIRKNMTSSITTDNIARTYSWDDKKEVVHALSQEDYKKEGEPFVLIIDEINRGNVSQIFGELITLLEDDKRLGYQEGLQILLPYSKEKFGVPSNLYVIGTMNTADRSVEALDSALRRRFDFIEMPPKPEIFVTERHDKGIVEGIDLQELLSIINERIEQILDNDHLIGHSYFMGVSGSNDLKHCFQQNIIPLLQEYFFGDYGKIGLVLGKGFVSKKEASQSNELFADFDYDSTSLNDRPIYKIKNVSLMDDKEFSDSIIILMGNDK